VLLLRRPSGLPIKRESYLMSKESWICPRCGLDYDRRNEWEMSQIDGHLDRHQQEESN